MKRRRLLQLADCRLEWEGEGEEREGVEEEISGVKWKTRPIRMVEGGKERRKEDQRGRKDGMKGGGDMERALRGNGRWGKMERERRRARTSVENEERSRGGVKGSAKYEVKRKT